LSNFGGRPPRVPSFLRLRIWSDFSGIVRRIPRLRRQSRLARDPYALSAPHPVRSAARSAGAYAGHPDALQDRLELWTVVPLAGGDQEGERLLSVLNRQVYLRGQTAA
jgi:hypothetical protein